MMIGMLPQNAGDNSSRLIRLTG